MRLPTVLSAIEGASTTAKKMSKIIIKGHFEDMIERIFPASVLNPPVFGSLRSSPRVPYLLFINFEKTQKGYSEETNNNY